MAKMIQVPAFGRTFKIGQFYDLSLDSVVDVPQIPHEILATSMKETILSESVNEKCSYQRAFEILGVDLNTRLNVCLGLVEPEIELKPLFEFTFLEKESSQKECFFVEKYAKKVERIEPSKFVTLVSGHLSTIGSATHIVTGIVHGWAKVSAEDGGKVSVQSSRNPDITDAQQKPPQTRQLQLELHPISHFQTGVVLHNIDETLAKKAVSFIHMMESLEAKSEQLMTGSKAGKPLIGHISGFKDLICKQREKAVEYLRELVPDIRRGENEEDEMEGFIENMEDSPFGPESVVQWLLRKEQDLLTLNEISTNLGPKACISSPLALSTKVRKIPNVCNLHIQVPKKDKDILLVEMEKFVADPCGPSFDTQLLENYLADTQQLPKAWKLMQGHVMKEGETMSGLLLIEESEVPTVECQLRFYANGKLVNSEVSSQGKSEKSIPTESMGSYSMEEPKAEMLSSLPMQKSQSRRKVLADIPPGKPKGKASSHNTVRLEWTEPDTGKSGVSVLEYLIYDEKKRLVQSVEGDVTYTDIKINKKQIPAFTIQADYGDLGTSPHSEPSDPFISHLWEDNIPDNFEPMQAFGQPFAVGQLYDKCSGIALEENIKMKDLRGNVMTNYFKTKTHSSQRLSFEEALHKMAITPEICLDVALGALEPGRPKSFVSREKEILNANFFLEQYVTKTEHINQKSLQPRAFTNTDPKATHVIAGIAYGCDILSFDARQGSTKATEVYCSLEQGSRQNVSHANVSSDMKKILEKNPDQAVPVKVYLLPIPGRDYKPLDQSQTQNIIAIMNHYKKAEAQCTQMKTDSRIKSTDALRIKTDGFVSQIQARKRHLSKHFQMFVPEVRRANEQPLKLTEQIKAEANSQTNEDQVKKWFKLIEMDINSIDGIKRKLSGLDMYNSYEEMEMKIRLFSGSVFCFAVAISGDNTNYTHINEKLGTFLQIKNINQNKTASKFVFLICESLQNKSGPIGFEALIHKYRNGRMLVDDVRCLTKPNRVRAIDVTDSSIQLEWHDPGSGPQVGYNIYIKNQYGTPQKKHSQSCQMVIGDLNPDTIYKIKVCSVDDTMESEFSDEIRVKTIKEDVTSPPGKPECTQLASHKLQISWSRPSRISKQIQEYKVIDSRYGVIQKVPGSMISCIFSPRLDTEYNFTVVADCGSHGTSKPSDHSDPIIVVMTPQEKRRALITNPVNSELCKNEEGGPPIYLLKLNKIGKDGINTQKFEYGKPNPYKDEKVVMLLGATGSGKTTLINAMINYVFGIEWDDDFRVRLIPEEKEAANQAKSQTSKITSYTIHHQTGFKVDYTLTIVDTPGFGDTAGITRDKEITQQIGRFFKATDDSGLQNISVVGFVAQSALARLSISQKYIFDSILSLFGNDIGENIVPLLTFADFQNPQILAALKEADIKYKEYFKFNNSVLYAGRGNKREETMARLYWQMGSESVNAFLQSVKTMTTKSLTLTKQLITERETLHSQIEGINEDISKGLLKLRLLDGKLDVLKTHKKDIELNKNFEVETEAESYVLEPVPDGVFTTTCKICKNITCHSNCIYQFDTDKYKCSVMKDGHCTKCPRKCPWKKHVNLPHVCKTVIVKKKEPCKKILEKYNAAKGEERDTEKAVAGIKEDAMRVHEDVILKSIEAKKCITRIREIALKPNPLSTVEYIDMMIESEESIGDYGYMRRIEQLKGVRGTALILEQMTEEGYDPFHDKSDTIAKVKERYKSITLQDTSKCCLM